MQEITLDRLYRPVKPVTLGDRTLYVRALSGPEQEERSMYSVNQARRFLKRMNDPESVEYQYFLRMYSELSETELRALLVVAFSSKTQEEVAKENAPVYQPFPEDASEEERRAVMDSREQAEIDRKAKLEGIVQAKTDAYAGTLDGKSRDDLFAIVKGQISERETAEAANKAYAHYTLYLSVQDKDGKRYFASPEEASGLHKDVIFQIYRPALEINQIDPLALNGPSATA